MARTHLANFGIGALAALTAALFPKLLPVLVGTGAENELVWFSVQFLAACLVFAVLVGAVVAVFEADHPRPPRQTFQAALGIPALLAGALNTGMVANDMGDDIHRLQQALEASAALPIEEVGVRQPAVPPAVRPAGMAGRSLAQLGVQGQASYYVVLGRAPSEAAARQQARDLAVGHRGLELHVVALPGGAYAVATTPRPQTRTDALVEGAELKRQSGLEPVLVRLR
jgi:hypothetical protein